MARSSKRLILAAAVLIAAGVGAYLLFHGRGSDDLAEARQALESRDFAKAELILDEHLRVHPTDRDALLLAARAARGGRHMRVAARHIDDYEKAGGDSQTANLERRLLAVQGGNLAEVDDLIRYCDEHQDGPDVTPILLAVVEGCQAAINAQVDRGELDPNGPDVKRACRAADKLLARPLSPAERLRALVRSGDIHYRAQNQPRAVADYREAVALDPDDFDARIALAMTIAQELPAETAEHLEKLHRQRPDHVNVLFGLATVRRGLGQPEEAAKRLDELLTLQPGNPQYLAERAWVEIDLGNPRHAEQYARLAWQAAPNQPEVSHVLGVSLRLQKKEAEARPFLEAFWLHEAEVRKKRADAQAPKK
jgi:tetratricopeptide (TPR) repeat protein